MLNYRSADTLFRRASGTVACVSVLALTAIVLFLLAQGLPIFKDVPIGDFLFTTDWYPTDEPPVFGLGAMIVGSFAAAVLTAVIAVPLGVLTAAALHCAVPAWAARILKPVIELMAALPSVVIGFIGMVIVAPWLQETFNLPTGLNLFNAGLMLAFMCIPTIASISEDALRNVPTMQGQMPPSLIMLRGASVKNSQVMAGMAFQKMTPSIETSESTHTRAAPRITVKPARPERLRILRSFIMRS